MCAALSPARSHPGLSSEEIAEALVLSEATVKPQVSNLLGKLGLAIACRPAIYAYESGLITPR